MKGYSVMGGDEKPFARDGMSVDEICCLWRESKRDKDQIRIISQLCGTSPAKVTEFLEARGYEVNFEYRYTARSKKPLTERYGVEGYAKIVEAVKELSVKMSADEIAEKLNLSRHSVYQIAWKHGLKFRDRMIHNEEMRLKTVEECRRLGEEENLSAREIANRLGYSVDYIRKLAKKYGFKYRKAGKGAWANTKLV